MSRIHRALGGDLVEHPRYDGRLSYEVITDKEVLRFDPESNAYLSDGPCIHIRGNRIRKRSWGSFESDLKFSLDLNNIDRVVICETNEEAKFVKALPGTEIHLRYGLKRLGGIPQIRLETVTTDTKS